MGCCDTAYCFTWAIQVGQGNEYRVSDLDFCQGKCVSLQRTNGLISFSMEWLNSLFIEHSGPQAVIVLALICAVGLALGKIRFYGISLGVTFVFFAGIVAGHFGLSIDRQMLNYVESFGLVIFVYALGLQVGPGFFSSFRKEGIQLNVLAIAVVLTGTAMTIGGSFLLDIPLPDMMGILCGATTNTPALGAAQQTLKSIGTDGSTLALGCAVAYPLGVLGVILAIIFVRKVLAGQTDRNLRCKEEENQTFITAFHVHNPAVFGKNLREVAHLCSCKFVVSRIWHNGKVALPTSDTVIMEGDHLIVVTSEKNVDNLTVLFGEHEATDWNKEDIDWNTIDGQLISQRIVITRPELNGKKLGSLRLRNLYGINISRVYRSGVPLLATPDLRLQLGDRLNVVGEASSIPNVERLLGNVVKNLSEPNLVAVFVGILLGLALGSVPLYFPGMSTPVKLGLAGGPIIVGILIGTFGPRLHMVTYTTRSANLMLRALGLSLYLACLGLDAGAHFFETVVGPEGLLWLGAGFALTVVPVLIVGVVAYCWLKLDYGTVSGVICGSMTNPMVLEYANNMVDNDNPAVSYATVYPLSIFLRVLLAQLMIMFFI